MLDNYEINSSTLAIIPISINKSKVLELENSFIVNKSSFDIINDSCIYYGSTYKGRYDGTKNLIGMNYKLPIIVEETKNIIFFPTTSPRLLECSWLSLKNIKKYIKNDKFSTILFKNDKIIDLDVSIYVLESQILRASRLESIMQTRKEI